MRIERFETFLGELIAAAGPPFEQVQTFAEAGVTNPHHGLVIRLATGADLHVQLIQVRPPGEDLSTPEEITEGTPPEPVTAPPGLSAGAPLRVKDIDAKISALIINAGHPEIKAVHPPTTSPIGLIVNFHSTRWIQLLHRHTLRPGEQPSEASVHKPRSEV